MRYAPWQMKKPARKKTPEMGGTFDAGIAANERINTRMVYEDVRLKNSLQSLYKLVRG